VPATLSHHLRSRFDCLHAPPPLGSPIANPTTRCSPARKPPQPTAGNIIHAQPAFVATRSQSSCSRCTQRTAELQHRQPRHPAETRCQRRCSSCLNPIACTHRRPSARPVASLTTRCSPAHNRPSPQHATSSMHSRRSQPLAHSAAAADARSLLLRSSFISCSILTRLGASDDVPSSPI
jgi:hypothetical protein